MTLFHRGVSLRVEKFDPGAEYVQTNVRVRKEADTLLGEVACYSGTSKSAIVRQALEDWFRNNGQVQDE